MIVTFLVVLFALIACLEPIAYGIYEIEINKNKPGGLFVIFFTIFVLIFALIMYFLY